MRLVDPLVECLTEVEHPQDQDKQERKDQRQLYERSAAAIPHKHLS
jgi:hypothetical protein